MGRGDDFNIGALRDGKLDQFYWMYNELQGHYMDEIAKQIGISPV